MDQRLLLTPPDAEADSSENQSALPEKWPAANFSSEPYRRTEIHRLPETIPYGYEQIYLPPQEQIKKKVFRHWLLLALTVVTTSLAGAVWFGLSLKAGMTYSLTVLVILGAHEMGHYIASRWYGVDATYPYFIPFFIPPIGPIPLIPQIGTFGAFIRIKSAIPSRKALFDIGIAGPLAGFVFVIPAAFIAHYFAQPAQPFVEGGGGIILQDPLLFKLFHVLFRLPEEVELNPVMLGAWVGALMTALNLMPVGQLDGGHVTYSILGRLGHRVIAITCYVSVITLTVYSLINGAGNWILYAVILTFMLRSGHPPVIDEREPIGFGRKLVAIIGLIVFILCFMTVPIRLVG